MKCRPSTSKSNIKIKESPHNAVEIKNTVSTKEDKNTIGADSIQLEMLNILLTW